MADYINKDASIILDFISNSCLSSPTNTITHDKVIEYAKEQFGNKWSIILSMASKYGKEYDIYLDKKHGIWHSNYRVMVSKVYAKKAQIRLALVTLAFYLISMSIFI